MYYKYVLDDRSVESPMKLQKQSKFRFKISDMTHLLTLNHERRKAFV